MAERTDAALCLALAALCGACGAEPPSFADVMLPAGPLAPGAQAKVYATVLSQDGLARAELHSSSDCGATFLAQAMEEVGPTEETTYSHHLEVDLPSLSAEGELWMYLEIADQAGRVARSPQAGADGPLRMSFLAADTPAERVFCPIPSCGDGEVQAHLGEGCDDGNAVNDDGCTDRCALPRCGDGIVQAGEECDTGDRTVCSAACISAAVDGGAGAS